MDLEKQYQMMHKLQIFKTILKNVETLKVELNKNNYRYFVDISARVMQELDVKLWDDLVNDIKNTLKPSLESKVRELEEEIKNK